MIHDPRGIFEVIVSSYVLANKAYQSETKIENKYRLCTINILKVWYLGSSVNVLMNMHVPVEDWDAFPC